MTYFTCLLVMLVGSPAMAHAAVKIDQTEVSIAEFAKFVAATGYITKAEQTGGMVYEAGWVTKPDWNWRQPYGVPSDPQEPAVHITFDEAEDFCKWQGKRLPTRQEWISYGYTEMRDNPPSPFVSGRTYPYPTGDSSNGANCLGACGAAKGNPAGKKEFSDYLNRGYGHARVGTTKAGVNGLFDMGANVWEWARSDQGAIAATMGGSWWYGAAQMKAHYGATKPRDMAAIYIGFRCISD